MKTHVLLNAGVGDFYGNPVLYSNTNRNRFITIRRDMYGRIRYYANNASFKFSTLKRATIQMLIWDKKATYYERYWK